MNRLKYIWFKWVKGYCPHICRFCKYNEHKYECYYDWLIYYWH